MYPDDQTYRYTRRSQSLLTPRSYPKTAAERAAITKFWNDLDKSLGLVGDGQGNLLYDADGNVLRQPKGGAA